MLTGLHLSRPDTGAITDLRRIPARLCCLLDVPPPRTGPIFGPEPPLDTSAPALGLARDWLPQPLQALVLCGPAGTGKTVALAWLVSQVTGAVYLAEYDLALVAGDAEIMGRIYRAPLLVLDDCDATLAGPWLAFALRMIRRCYDAGRRLAIGSNHLPAALNAALGSQVADRLREMAGEYHQCVGVSRRTPPEVA